MEPVAAVHVVAGSIVLAVAPAALIVRKGGVRHRRLGTAFTLAMAVVLLSSGFMWQQPGHLFLFPLALVSAYLVFHGWRVIARRRRRASDALDDTVDVAASFVTAACAVWLVAIAAGASGELMRSLVPVLLGLAVIAAGFGLNDLRGIGRRRRGPGWLLAHLCAMISAYCSAVTAFVVINAHGVPMLFRWLVPIALASLLMTAYSVRVRLAARGGARPSATRLASAPERV